VKRILAGDIGGTKSLLQLVSLNDDTQRVESERRYETDTFPTFEAMLREFIPEGTVDAACFAIAGPVYESRASLTNVGWEIAEAKIQSEFRIANVTLVNDFYAVARGIPILTDADLETIQKGVGDQLAPIGVIGAGTGLGEAILIPSAGGDEWRIVSSEGGHCDFAPRDETQQKLLANLASRFGHVSYERLVSGPGLVNIHTFLRDHVFEADESKRDQTYDLESLPARISQSAKEGDRLASATMDLFVDVYGAEAGNLALKILALGGIFLAGGIAAKNLDRFRNGRFVEAFCSKGRFRSLMERIPIHIITNPKVGLLGAAELAREAAVGEASKK